MAAAFDKLSEAISGSTWINCNTLELIFFSKRTSSITKVVLYKYSIFIVQVDCNVFCITYYSHHLQTTSMHERPLIRISDFILHPKDINLLPYAGHNDVFLHCYRCYWWDYRHIITLSSSRYKMAPDVTTNDDIDELQFIKAPAISSDNKHIN